MSFRAYCAGCGKDCSNAYATWYGDPYHIGCIPDKPKKREARDIEEEMMDCYQYGRNSR